MFVSSLHEANIKILCSIFTKLAQYTELLSLKSYKNDMNATIEYTLVNYFGIVSQQMVERIINMKSCI